MNTSTATRKPRKVSLAKSRTVTESAAHAHYTKLDANLQPLPRTAKTHAAVHDARTGLVWDVTTHEAKTHAHAVEMAGQVHLGDQSDWRLPERNELIGITDLSRFDPCIDTEFFPKTPSRFFWSNTAYAPNPAGFAWGVNFNNGLSNYYDRDSDLDVRAVRGPVVRPGQ